VVKRGTASWIAADIAAATVFFAWLLLVPAEWLATHDVGYATGHPL
jgi:hypothetical protein